MMKFKPSKSAMKFLLNSNGSALLQVLIVGTVGLIIGAGISQTQLKQRYIYSQFNLRTNVMMIRQAIIAMVSSEVSWNNTRNANTQNPNMRCGGGANTFCEGDPAKMSSFKLIDGGNSLFYDSTLPTSGFTKDGQVCNSFDSLYGNDHCPLKVVLRWRAECPAAATCTQPNHYDDYIEFNFIYKPRSEKLYFPFNPAFYKMPPTKRLHLTGNHSPALICAQQGGIFIGQDKTFNSVKANPSGCVPYSTFIGPPGPQGPPGSEGSIGPQGPEGPPGANAVCP